MNLDEINPVDKIKKGFNTFKNGFKGKSKEGFSNDELSTDENAYLSNIDKHPKFTVKNSPGINIENVCYANLNGGAKVKITFDNIETDKDSEKMRTVTGLTITNIGTGSNYKAGDTIVITTDKIMNSDAPSSMKVATDDTDGDEDKALRFTITDTSENDWGKFISELISLFILLILFSIIGANIVHLSNLPMGALDTLLPSDWNSAPYRGEYLKSSSLFKKLNDSETREDLLEFLFPMKSVAFPYTYDSLYRNDELEDLGLEFYVIWPLKWLARTTAWAWSTGRLLIKYFIAFLKWMMTYIKSDSVTFFLGPFILMFALSTQLTSMIGFILMYIGGFMTDVKDGWVLAIFALVIFIIVAGIIIYGICSGLSYICMLSWGFCVDKCPSGVLESSKDREYKKKLREAQVRLATAEDDRQVKLMNAKAEVIEASIPLAPGASKTTQEQKDQKAEKDEWAKAILAIGITGPNAVNASIDMIKKQFTDLLDEIMGGFIGPWLKLIILTILSLFIISIAVVSIGFSSMYNTANGMFMTIQLAIFSLINLLFKNNGIALMKTEISKHVKGLTIIFILFSLAMARGNLTTNISNSYIFAGIVVIISIIFSMFKKDKE